MTNNGASKEPLSQHIIHITWRVFKKQIAIVSITNVPKRRRCSISFSALGPRVRASCESRKEFRLRPIQCRTALEQRTVRRAARSSFRRMLPAVVDAAEEYKQNNALQLCAIFEGAKKWKHGQAHDGPD